MKELFNYSVYLIWLKINEKRDFGFLTDDGTHHIVTPKYMHSSIIVLRVFVCDRLIAKMIIAHFRNNHLEDLFLKSIDKQTAI